MTLALSFPLLDAMGVTGIGVATLISQGSVALVLLATELRPVLLSRGQGLLTQASRAARASS